VKTGCCIARSSRINTHPQIDVFVIILRPITQEEIPAARQIILKVAYDIYRWDKPFEDMVRHFETNGEFSDMDNVEAHYFQNDGIFLVILDEGTIIGSGAIRKLNKEIAELKRMWLLDNYHGKGIGYKLITQLFDFSRSKNYEKVYLQTGPEQTRAINFYKKIGFMEISPYNEKTNEISMSLDL